MANLKYITFDQMMASVESDLSKYADNGMINRGSYIKVARKVNEDLGLKIYKEKEAVLKIENYKADLPVDFLYLQMALICGKPQEYNMPAGTIWGTHTEEHNISATCVKPDNVCLSSNGTSYWVSQTFKEKTVKVASLSPIMLSRRSQKFCAENCVNNTWSGAYEIDIQEEQAIVNFKEGEVYINYLSDMVDENNNVLILDHPLLTDYYEYAVKKRILENMLLNGDAQVRQVLGDMKEELRDSRLRALSFVNTIEYTDIQDLYKANRKRFYNRYHKMFY